VRNVALRDHELDMGVDCLAACIRQAVGMVRVHMGQQDRVDLFWIDSGGGEVFRHVAERRPHAVLRAGIDQRHASRRMDHEGVHRNARRRRAVRLFQDALGILRRDVAGKIVTAVQIAVADRRHHNVADPAAIDAGDLRGWYGGLA
jgi:hypothetical protein